MRQILINRTEHKKVTTESTCSMIVEYTNFMDILFQYN